MKKKCLNGKGNRAALWLFFFPLFLSFAKCLLIRLTSCCSPAPLSRKELHRSLHCITGVLRSLCLPAPSPSPPPSFPVPVSHSAQTKCRSWRILTVSLLDILPPSDVFIYWRRPVASHKMISDFFFQGERGRKRGKFITGLAKIWGGRERN